LAYSQKTFSSTIKLASLLMTLLIIAAVIVLVFEQISEGFRSFIISLPGISVGLVFVAIYVKGRKAIIRAHLRNS
jgi:hypothetical protein